MFCSLVLAATVLTANAADRLLIVGEAVWGGWSIDNSIVMFNSTENPDVFKATVNLNANGTFKFLTTTATAEYFTLRRKVVSSCKGYLRKTPGQQGNEDH